MNQSYLPKVECRSHMPVGSRKSSLPPSLLSSWATLSHTIEYQIEVHQQISHFSIQLSLL